ncbi:curli-like amyloid fiber formation chaperone CsgH [Rhizobium halophytocola]|uniref:Uncharacterized protein n=1 Tax=Rhizobium halophytocola TaxID=735519 RepID=A0ABS4DUS8_9HYPH|nr:curli-like amyloid fiber formation chaperone CsgH [Rhizobium halophytocola]MBP1849446.1 hypothetical protein [Rhizobium halophytocola]
MAPQIVLLLVAFSLAGHAGLAEADDQDATRIYGIPSGSQVEDCGIEIAEGALTRLSPFLDAADNLQGSYRLMVITWTSGSVAETRQENRIDAGELKASNLFIDHPDRLRVTLEVWTEQGATVCLLEHQLSLGKQATDI